MIDILFQGDVQSILLQLKIKLFNMFYMSHFNNFLCDGDIIDEIINISEILILMYCASQIFVIWAM